MVEGVQILGSVSTLLVQEHFPHPLVAIALVLVLLGSLMIGLKLWQRYGSPHPELTRKILHISMGGITLSFPWLFQSAWPVILLAGLAMSWLLTIRLYPPLNRRLGSVLGGVGRRSLGEIYFPIAVALIFTLAQGDPLLFGIPILMLTLADAVAAIIGVRYGKLRYVATEGHKSAEGSVTFFTVAFLSVHIPLLLLSDVGRAETLLIGLILGSLVMMLEAIAWSGLDNILIPLGGFLLLTTHLDMTVTELLTRFVITLILAIFTLTWRQRTTLSDSALLGATFIGYLTWSVGGWLWLLPPSIVLLGYPSLISWIKYRKQPPTPQEFVAMPWLPRQVMPSGRALQAALESPSPEPESPPWRRVHSVAAVLSVSAAGLFWLFWFPIGDRPAFFYAYSFSYATSLAIIGVAGLSPVNYWNRSSWVIVGRSIMQGSVLTLWPLLIWQGMTSLTVVAIALGFLATTLGAIAYYLIQPWLKHQLGAIWNWCSRSAIALLTSLLGLIPAFYMAEFSIALLSQTR